MYILPMYSPTIPSDTSITPPTSQTEIISDDPVALDKIVRFLRHRTVDRLAILVVGVDDVPELRGDAFVAFDQQLDGQMCIRDRYIIALVAGRAADGRCEGVC